MAGDKKKKEEPKWDFTKLAVGNTFSGTSYYKATAKSGDMVTTNCAGKDITVGRDILEEQMNNASVFATTEKLSLTKRQTRRAFQYATHAKLTKKPSKRGYLV